MTRQTFFQRNKIAIIAITLITALIVLPILWQFWIAPTVVEGNLEAGQEIADDTFNKEKALQDYREFRTKYYSIQEQHQQTLNYKEDHDRFHNVTWPDDGWKDSRDARERHGRIHQRITGSQNQEEMLIAEYNAMSADATTSLYQCHLPNSVDEKLFITDGTGIEYKQDANQGAAPKEPDQSCKYSDVPDSALQD